MIIRKRGVTHIEIILSFLIFVTAVSFALYFFRPTDTSRIVETSLDYIFREINGNASTIVRIYSVKINNDTIANLSEEGERKKKILKIVFKDVEPEMKTYAETRNGTMLESKYYKDAGVPVHLLVKSPFSEGWIKIDFIYIYFSEEFVEGKVSGGGVLEGEDFYKIGSSYSENIISWNKTLKLAQAYQTNYFNLKEQFNIPGRVNFGFSLIVNSTVNITAQREIPERLDVFTEQRRVKVLKDNKITYGDLIVRVW